MHITAYDDHADECKRIANKILTPELLATLKKRLDDELSPLLENAVTAIEEESGDIVSNVAARRAEKFLEAVLAGDENAALNLFGLSGFNGRRTERPVIHGRIFESSPVKLRRQLVEAHADLLRDARIADLEALLEGARRQIVDLEERLDYTRNVK